MTHPHAQAHTQAAGWYGQPYPTTQPYGHQYAYPSAYGSHPSTGPMGHPGGYGPGPGQQHPQYPSHLAPAAAAPAPHTAAPGAPSGAGAGAGVGSVPYPGGAVAVPPPAASASAAAAPAAPTPVVVDITRLIRPPHRVSRPRKLLVVLRGLPGSGKSTLAKKIREAEVEAGADPPRLHSIDDYYMQEVEVEVVEEEGGRKKRRKVTELKYVYEEEMEATYFRDLVRALGRSCDDRRHSFVVVDAPVLRVEQLRELMAVGQRANFECFALRPLETDLSVLSSPARNLHGHSLERLRQMAASWEDAPPLYAQVSAVSLFGGPVVGEEAREGTAAGRGGRRSAGVDGEDDEIQEVDMDDDEGNEDSEEYGSDEAAAAAAARGGDGGEAAADSCAPGRRPTSRWHDDADGDGGGDGREDVRERKKRMKRERAQRAKAVAGIDERGILAGLNDALSTEAEADLAARGRGGSGPAGGAVWRRGAPPQRSALRRVASEGAVSGAGVGARGRRRVWWPDVGQGRDCTAGEASPSPALTPPPQQLVDVVYLEGLGPPVELEDLPYGYQRKAAAAGAGRGVMAAAAAGPGGFSAAESSQHYHHHHHNFRDQAKAEHESEHDLFRRLLLGKQVGGGAAGRSAGGTPLGVFESGLDDEEEGS